MNYQVAKIGEGLRLIQMLYDNEIDVFPFHSRSTKNPRLLSDSVLDWGGDLTGVRYVVYSGCASKNSVVTDDTG